MRTFRVAVCGGDQSNLALCRCQPAHASVRDACIYCNYFCSPYDYVVAIEDDGKPCTLTSKEDREYWRCRPMVVEHIKAYPGVPSHYGYPSIPLPPRK
jgi:hypothetical protein